MTIHERQGSIQIKLKFHRVDEENIDMDQDVAKLRKKLMQKYSSVFKKDLGPKDRLNMDPVKVELVDNPETMGNCMVPVEKPRHLQSAAKEELARLLKTGCLEPVNHPTSNWSRAF